MVSECKGKFQQLSAACKILHKSKSTSAVTDGQIANDIFSTEQGVPCRIMQCEIFLFVRFQQLSAACKILPKSKSTSAVTNDQITNDIFSTEQGVPYEIIQCEIYGWSWCEFLFVRYQQLSVACKILPKSKST